MEIAHNTLGSHGIVSKFRLSSHVKECAREIMGFFKRISGFSIKHPVAFPRLMHVKRETEDALTPSPRHPLAGLAVHIDVDFRAAVEMLRIAGIAAAQEAKAFVQLGSQGRFQKVTCLHEILEKLWLLPRGEPVGRLAWGNETTVLSNLQDQHKQHVRECTLTPSTICNNSSPDIFSSRNSSCDVCLDKGASITNVTQDMNGEMFLKKQEVLSALPSTSPLKPLLKQDGTVIAPPLRLLAAYAEPKSHTERFAIPSQRLSRATGSETARGGLQTAQSTPGCIVGLCVRSLLDLYVQAIRSLEPALLPTNSVVLVAAVNAPMMFKVLEEHNLIVQPLDLNTLTLLPTEESLNQAVKCWGTRIKALMFSHLYGGVCDVDVLADFCTKHRLLFVEDCAEAFVGELYRGHPRADISLFSFGLIKTCTAAGGGIATVRGFPSNGELFKLLRVQPNASMLAVLLKRLESWNLEEFAEQQSRTFKFAHKLLQLGLQIPGAAAAWKTFWLFPVIAPPETSPIDFERALRECGIYAASDATTLICYKKPSPKLGGRGVSPVAASEMMHRIIYLPVNRHLADRELRQVEKAVAKACRALKISRTSTSQ